MVRKSCFAIGLAIALLAARDASAIPVLPTDLDTWVTGPSIAATTFDAFDVALGPPPTNGTIGNDVYFDAGTGNYTYVHTVTPELENNVLLSTGFSAGGFTGVAGYSFGSSLNAGGAGTGADFLIDDLGGQLNWRPTFDGGTGWDGFEPIVFFFVSTNAPAIGDYNLLAFDNLLTVGTGQSYAPIPEPGTMALLGSGLVGLYAARRRRRNLAV